MQNGQVNIRYWSGDEFKLSSDVALIRCGGHLPGSTVLHWKSGPRPGGALFTGDALQVAMDRRSVSFMFSYPNLIPMNPADVPAMRERLAVYDFEDAFGYSRGRNIIGGAREAVDRSFDRYLRAIAAWRDQRRARFARSLAVSRLMSGHEIAKISVPWIVPITWRQRAVTPARNSMR